MGDKLDTFRQYLPDLNQPRFTIAKTQDAHAYVHDFKTNRNPPWLFDLTQAWEQLYSEPFVGITNDGHVKEGLVGSHDDSTATEQVVEAVNALLAQLSADQTRRLRYPINAKEWRGWSNPEFLLRNFGLRLDELLEQQAQLVLNVLKKSFSSEGFEKALGAMRMNHFLGQLCNIPRVMNKYSYNFLLFGVPSITNSWGWSLYGHHLCLNVFFKDHRIVISPTFTGAEPNVIDDGEFQGIKILQKEGDLGLRLMQSLGPRLQDQAQAYKLMRDPAMRQSGDLINDRWNQDDQRHLCGAFRDNRQVPYEGICVIDLESQQKQLVLDIAEEFLIYLPEKARNNRIAQIEKFFSETYFCWIGGYGEENPFYYRIQSPVVILEFDHHSGVFLTNKQPAKFHTHTIVRTPNGGDYGNGLRSENEKL